MNLRTLSPLILLSIALSSNGIAQRRFTAKTYALEFRPNGDQLLVSRESRKETVLMRGWGYRIFYSDGTLALSPTRAKSVKVVPQRGVPTIVVSYRLEGLAKSDSSFKAMYRIHPDHLKVKYYIRFGRRRKLNTWTTGFFFNFIRDPGAVRSRAYPKWVRPTGKKKWEVVGDAPYQVVHRHFMEAHFKREGGTAANRTKVVFSFPYYVPDWCYGNDLKRARFLRIVYPTEGDDLPVLEHAFEFEIFVERGATPLAEMAARAEGLPFALAISTNRVGNLFEPGRPISLTVWAKNVTESRQSGAIRYEVGDYYGKRIAGEALPLHLSAGQTFTKKLSLNYQRRGILFAGATAEKENTKWEYWTTLGILPRRRASDVRLDSPFGMAAYIANNKVYIDQPQPEKVLAMLRRIGVRWVRRGFAVKKYTEQEIKRLRDIVTMERQNGILWHAQANVTLPKDSDEANKLAQNLEAAIKTIRDLTNYVEVGNELNFVGGHGSGKAAAGYVSDILTPHYNLMRRLHPQGKVMTMGLGGVDMAFLNNMIQAGGWKLFDILSIHPGFYPRSPDYSDRDDFWTLLPQLENVQRLLDQHGKKAVWITEVYAPTAPMRQYVDVRTAADYLVRTYTIALSMGVKVIEWYQFQDGIWWGRTWNPANVEFYFGIVRPDLTPKPAYIAYGVMTQKLEGARFVKRRDMGDPLIWVLEFDRSGQPVFVMWSRHETNELDRSWPNWKSRAMTRKPGYPWQNRWRETTRVGFPADDNARVTDIMGNSHNEGPTGGRLLFDLTGSPVFVEGKLGEEEGSPKPHF